MLLCTSRALTHSTENTVCWGRGIEPPTTARLLDAQKPTKLAPSSKHIAPPLFPLVTLLSTPSPQSFCSNASVPIPGWAALHASAAPFRRSLPQLFLLTRRRLPGTTINLINEEKTSQEDTPHCPASLLQKQDGDREEKSFSEYGDVYAVFCLTYRDVFCLTQGIAKV